MDRILEPDALFRCPVSPSIGPLGLDRVGALNPSAVAERSEGDGKGSPLYRLHMWYEVGKHERGYEDGKEIHRERER